MSVEVRSEWTRATTKYGLDFGISIGHTDKGTWNISRDDAHLVLLQEIRDELKTLNALLGCKNFVGIPRTLDRIATATETAAGTPRKQRAAKKGSHP